MKEQIEQAIRRATEIGRYLTGKLSREENEGVRLGEEEERLVREVVSRENAENSLEQYKRLNAEVERGWKKWQDDRKSKRRAVRFRIAGIAAAVTLLLGTGVYWYQAGQTVAPVSTPVEIKPGSFRATLYTGDRKVIEIEDNMNAVLAGDSSVVVANNELKHVETSDGTPKTNTLVVPRGGEFSIVLADGTKVWLNADTRLTYPTRFTGERREVELEGEAYFEVRHDEKHPFIVRTGKSAIRVYGTAFNVKAYPGDMVQKTTLEEGSIGLTVDEKEFRLVPNEQAVLDANNRVTIRPLNAREQSVWRHGRFLFDNERLEDIMAQLARWYDVNIFFAGSKIKELHFSGEVNRYEDINQVLRMVALTTHITFSIQGKTISIMQE